MEKYDKSVLFNMNKKNLHNIIYFNIVSCTRVQYFIFLNYDFFFIVSVNYYFQLFRQ